MPEFEISWPMLECVMVRCAQGVTVLCQLDSKYPAYYAINGRATNDSDASFTQFNIMIRPNCCPAEVHHQKSRKQCKQYQTISAVWGLIAPAPRDPCLGPPQLVASEPRSATIQRRRLQVWGGPYKIQGTHLPVPTPGKLGQITEKTTCQETHLGNYKGMNQH